MALSTRVYAPKEVGFICTQKDRFTYFSGSGAGTRTTFGLSCQELATLFATFTNDCNKSFLKDHLELQHKLTALNAELQTLARHLTDNHSQRYIYAEDIAQGIVESGHIPIMLSAAVPAIQFKRSARSVNSTDIANYFREVATAREQAKEYLLKQEMMMQISSFRDAIFQLRYQHNNSPIFYACNQLIIKLDNDVIKENQKSMPESYAQFDLCKPFFEKVYNLTSKLDKARFGQLKFDIVNQLKIKGDGNTYSAQKNLSEVLFTMLKEFLQKNGIDPNKEELSLDEQQDDLIQTIAPLLEYLCSPNNPFARDGIFGELIVTPFHTKALTEYQAHESQEAVHLRYFKYQDLTASPEEKVEYTGDQIAKLLFGSDDNNAPQNTTSSFLNRIGSTLRYLITDAARNGGGATRDERTERLALPMPDKYLAIEAPRPDQGNQPK